MACGLNFVNEVLLEHTHLFTNICYLAHYRQSFPSPELEDRCILGAEFGVHQWEWGV